MQENDVRILLVRHGYSEGNDDIDAYIKKGDMNVGLMEEGWRQAMGTGGFLASHYAATGTLNWPNIFISDYLRTRQTFSGIWHGGLEGLFKGVPKIRSDACLVEKFFGAASLLERLPEGIDLEFARNLKALLKATYERDPFTSKNFLGESTKETVAFVKSFIDGTLSRDIIEGKRDFLIVTHGAVIQAFIMNWMHVGFRDKNKIGNPNNGDVIEISGRPKNWKVTKIYDGEKFEAVNIDIMRNIKPFTIDELPPVPDGLKYAL